MTPKPAGHERPLPDASSRKEPSFDGTGLEQATPFPRRRPVAGQDPAHGKSLGGSLEPWEEPANHRLENPLEESFGPRFASPGRRATSASSPDASRRETQNEGDAAAARTGAALERQLLLVRSDDPAPMGLPWRGLLVLATILLIGGVVGLGFFGVKKLNEHWDQRLQAVQLELVALQDQTAVREEERLQTQMALQTQLTEQGSQGDALERLVRSAQAELALTREQVARLEGEKDRLAAAYAELKAKTQDQARLPAWLAGWGRATERGQAAIRGATSRATESYPSPAIPRPSATLETPKSQEAGRPEPAPASAQHPEVVAPEKASGEPQGPGPR